jgi:diguanylate cyclase (GGDEF)-like protein/PAS domain S-box-containing protein
MKNPVLPWEDMFNVLPDAVVIVDGSGRIVFANQLVSGLLGYTAGELIGEPLGCLIPAKHRDTHQRHFVGFHDHGRPMSMGMRPLLGALHKSGQEVSISISIANFELDGRRYSVAVMRDGASLQSEITAAHTLAETDALTGIGSRLSLSRVMQSALAEARPFGLLFLDLEQFKPFNDTYGHAVGDQVLQIVARRLQAHIRTADLAARLGGDEFVVVLDGLENAERLGYRAAAISNSLVRPFHIGDLCSIFAALSVSISAARFIRSTAIPRRG